MPDIEDKLKSVDARTDRILDQFDSRLSSVLARAQAKTALSIRSKIEVSDAGVIKATAQNLRALRTLPQVFRTALSSEGYDSLASNFLASFDGGVPAFEEVLSLVADNYEVEAPDFTKEDEEYFAEVKQQTALNLEQVIDRVSTTARQSATLSVGGEMMSDLTVDLAERLQLTFGQAQSVAATGISTFYRTIAESGYSKIDELLSKSNKELRFEYYGPGDKLTRPFCVRLLAQTENGKTWSREQIDDMDNQQLPDVFTTCGGYNCRHQWIVAMDKE